MSRLGYQRAVMGSQHTGFGPFPGGSSAWQAQVPKAGSLFPMGVRATQSRCTGGAGCFSLGDSLQGGLQPLPTAPAERMIQSGGNSCKKPACTEGMRGITSG